MLRSAQPSQFSTYPSQYIDTPGLAVLYEFLSNLSILRKWRKCMVQILPPGFTRLLSGSHAAVSHVSRAM